MFLNSHPYKVLQGAGHHQRRGSAISVSGLKYLNKLLTSEVIAPSINIFKKMFGESLDRSLSPSPPLTEHSSTHFPTPPPSRLHTTHKQKLSLYVTQHPVLSMWFLQAHCGLLFTIINYNHDACDSS